MFVVSVDEPAAPTASLFPSLFFLNPCFFLLLFFEVILLLNAPPSLILTLPDQHLRVTLTFSNLAPWERTEVIIAELSTANCVVAAPRC